MPELAPEGVTVHFQRMVARGPVGTLANLQARAKSHLERMDETVEMIACVKPDVIVLAHTATSYFLGRDGEAELARKVERDTGIPFISALGSAVEACRELGLRKVAMGTAYDEALTLKGKDVKSIFDEPRERVYGLVREADRPEAQAVFLSGVGLHTLSVLAPAERELGKPVISSASAMMWYALRTAGVRAAIPGYGRLLTRP